MNTKIEGRTIWLLGIVTLSMMFDQIIKSIVTIYASEMPIVIIKNVLKLNYCQNRGGAFSIGEGNVQLIIVLNIIIIGGLIIFYKKNKESLTKLAITFLGMVIAGGVSNLEDRILNGYVIDFIDINEVFNFAVFNIADIFIVVGICGLGILFLFNKLTINNYNRI